MRLKFVSERKGKRKNLDSRGRDRVHLAQVDLINNGVLQESKIGVLCNYIQNGVQRSIKTGYVSA